MEGPTGFSLPQEIWWLIAQEFARRYDFGGLFLCARLGRGFARLALPELYAIHDQSPAIDGDLLDIKSSVCLWRSIIASSLSQTLYPYCCWIKALKLGNLHAQLEDLARDNPALKAQFFSPPLEKLQIRRGRGRALNVDAIVVEVANLVTERIRSSADQEQKRVGITMLEGYHLPTANLPTWVSSLSSLTSLAVRDGSVLTSDVARAIRASCPGFKELECFFCTGTDIDEQMAGFLRNLEPHTLESFTVLSMNEIARETFKALCEHSRSLKELSLLSLERPAFQSLNELQHCLLLESLELEGGFSVRHEQSDTEFDQVFQDVVQWLQKCTALRKLDFDLVPTSTAILAEILKSPTICLDHLDLHIINIDEEFCMALRRQQKLQRLRIRIVEEDEEGADGRLRMLTDAIACCNELRLLHTDEPFNFQVVNKICSSLPLLEDLVINGLLEDLMLTPLSYLKNLKSLKVYGPSIISPDALQEFLATLLNDADGCHDGLQIYISNQAHDFRFTDGEEASLATALRDWFHGKLDITYQPGGDELHESDFSD